MTTLVAKGEKYRIFSEKILGIFTYYILEDSSNATQKQGTWIGVEFQTYYFKTQKQVEEIAKKL